MLRTAIESMLSLPIAAFNRGSTIIRLMASASGRGRGAGRKARLPRIGRTPRPVAVPVLMLKLMLSGILALLILPGATPAQDRVTGTADRLAFTRTVPGLDAAARREAALGERLFLLDWPVAPGTGDAPGGLGPGFDRVSCAACHPRNGRGAPPGAPGEPASFILRLSLPGTGVHGEPLPHPAYGEQLTRQAIPGVPAEGRVAVEWEEVAGRYGDGTPYRLRRPRILLRDLAFGPLGGDVRLSLRTAPALAGLGLLEAVPDQTLVALAARQAAETPDLAGRLNRVWDPAAGMFRPGRFGWKAAVPDLRHQAAIAASLDIGLTSPLFPAESCPPVQAACRAAPVGPRPDLGDAELDRLTLYLRSLDAPPPSGAEDSAVVRGAALFTETGCAACHVPTLVAGPVPQASGLGGRTIHPYSDLLLHDMGEGLADGRPDFGASGREWRTAPLWGLGAGARVAGHDTLLHDGRARGPAEAILWHGGQAESAREVFRMMPTEDRAALLRYLGTL